MRTGKVSCMMQVLAQPFPAPILVVAAMVAEVVTGAVA
jgi:hypothetical protein